MNLEDIEGFDEAVSIIRELNEERRHDQVYVAALLNTSGHTSIGNMILNYPVQSYNIFLDNYIIGQETHEGLTPPGDPHEAGNLYGQA